jgi:predicted O-methyltransferase YrrM
VYGAQAARAIARDPFEGWERVLERIAERRDARRSLLEYEVDEQWERTFHEHLGVEWPCPAWNEFGSLWERVVGELRDRGLAVGRRAFGGWDDADPALARAAWCLTLHLRPRRVVETGVARGVTTRVILEALERVGDGRLWSIDLPPLIERELTRETAAAVPAATRQRWTYVRGSSRHRLPQLLGRLGAIDMFVHDSMHTTRNVLFELGCVWPALAEGGVALIDDVDMNAGVRRFSDATTRRATIGRSDDGLRLIGVMHKHQRRAGVA